jgi:N-acetylglucosaminyldiphosphoundecaprenol N-acetyl-beta-D-mannosaminyltransferase
MDHEEIKRRVRAAKPDLLLVSFGCPKQEKWIAMHYRSLGVPVTAGVGATIDFLAGEVKRAPVWMQRSGTEWIFRLAQEPRRLFRRYVTDLWVFGTSFLPQWWALARSRRKLRRDSPLTVPAWPANVDELSGSVRPDPVCLDRPGDEADSASAQSWFELPLPDRLDVVTIEEHPSLLENILKQGKHCVLDMRFTAFLDSTGVGFLIRLQKRLRALRRELVLMSPSRGAMRALKLMRLEDFFRVAPDREAVPRLLSNAPGEFLESDGEDDRPGGALRWRGEVTAANAEVVWARTQEYLTEGTFLRDKVIDLSEVRFIDSTGLGLMIRAKKFCLQRGEALVFRGLQPAVRNVLKLSRVEDFVLTQGGPARERALSTAA